MTADMAAAGSAVSLIFSLTIVLFCSSDFNYLEKWCSKGVIHLLILALRPGALYEPNTGHKVTLKFMIICHGGPKAAVQTKTQVDSTDER